jgi:hypothetical protein
VSKEIFQKMWEPPPITDTSRAEWSQFCTEDFKFKNDSWTSLLSATFCLVYVNWHTFLCVYKKLQMRMWEWTVLAQLFIHILTALETNVQHYLPHHVANHLKILNVNINMHDLG